MLAIRVVKMAGMGGIIMAPVTLSGVGLLFVALHESCVAIQHANNQSTVRHNMTWSMCHASRVLFHYVTSLLTLRPKACASSFGNMLHMTRW